MVVFYFALNYRGDSYSVNNKYDTNFVLQLHYKSVLDKRYDTRGHRYKLVPQLCKYDLRKHFL